ncbi:MAG: chemotaxis response regulator protein-glutamate methylesterase [Myxococcales bacterium]|nr:chemotaxis response regulator protein-glutamate methylesterase [Myxococcales bacterium]
MKGERPIRVLVVDDSASNRRAISQILEAAPDVAVVDRAADGDEGLRKAAALRPDVITLDLEMPRLDGFAFLRLLMASVPTPVIVISSYAHRSDVFKALELGAFDFIAKSGRPDRGALESIRAQLLEKVRTVRLLRPPRRHTPAQGLVERGPTAVVAIGASTGGPPAVQRLLESISGQPLCLLVCQHMPPRFTKAFADRLDRIGSFSVREARDTDPVKPGCAYIAPGGRHLALSKRGGGLEVRIEAPGPKDKHAPSVDHLFASVARALGGASVGVVLTGMGGDGAAGSMAIRRAGGEVWAESEETAVVFGMPKEAIASGSASRVLRLEQIGPSLIELLRARGQGR